MNTILKISQQTVWQLVGKAITSLSTIFILGMVSRHYGEVGTGVLTLALTFLSFFVLAADFGINAHLLSRFLGDNFSFEWRKLLGLRLVLTVVLVALAVSILIFWPGQVLFKQAALFGLVAVFESAVFATASIIFQSKLRFDLSVLAIALGTFVTTGMIFILVMGRAPEPVLMIGYSVGWIVTGIAALFFVRPYVKNIVPIIDLSFVTDVVRQSWPISLTLLLNVVYFRLDAFILSFNKSFTDVGVYNLAYQIFQSLLVVPTFIMNGLYPLMLRDFSENKSRFVSNLAKASFLMLALAVLGVVLTILLSPWVVSLITGGKGFSGSTESLQILSLSFPAFFVSSVLMWTMVTLKRYKTMLVIYITGLVVNAALNFIFIPHYSYIASSWITGISEYLILGMQLVILIPWLLKWRR